MKRSFLLGMLMVAAMSTASMAQTPPARIVNSQTGFVIGVLGGSMAQGAQLVVWHHVHGAPNQSWTIVPVGGGWFKIINLGSGQAIGVGGGRTDDGAKIVQWPDVGALNQQWRWERRPGGALLVNRGSGKVIGVTGGSPAEGTALIQWHEDGTPNQLWSLRR